MFIGIFLARKDYPTDGIAGLSLKFFRDNWISAYQKKDGFSALSDENIWVTLTFPAVTGIMAGSNRSASLKDTQRLNSCWDLAAIVSTSVLYLITVLFFEALATRDKLLTDRYYYVNCA
ncbi:Protein ccc1 [Salvia divinorum]|uniref:Protein ccc1 n=1 Tax=Salvia divinorum TaxID=28513 RepID=A0ABD1I6S1_SALDI